MNGQIFIKRDYWLRFMIFERNLILPNKVIDYLDATENGEASEEAHGASDQTKLSFGGHLFFLKSVYW